MWSTTKSYAPEVKMKTASTISRGKKQCNKKREKKNAMNPKKKERLRQNLSNKSLSNCITWNYISSTREAQDQFSQIVSHETITHPQSTRGAHDQASQKHPYQTRKKHMIILLNKGGQYLFRWKKKEKGIHLHKSTQLFFAQKKKNTVIWVRII